jgi:hypothetical protein
VGRKVLDFLKAQGPDAKCVTSYSGCDKISQTGWIRTSCIYHLAGACAQESEMGQTELSSKVSRPSAHAESAGQNLFLCLFVLPEASCIPWLQASSSTLS